jgi:archaemetzincin
MKRIRLLLLGSIERREVDDLREAVGVATGRVCVVGTEAFDIGFAFHPERQQYHSTEILARICSQPREGEWLVGVTDADLFIPILTFVFGEAQKGSNTAVASVRRLRQESYGLPRDAGLERGRLLKEILHEVGHLAGLRHCDEYLCIMASAHSVERVDLKSQNFCNRCDQVVRMPDRR